MPLYIILNCNRQNKLIVYNSKKFHFLQGISSELNEEDCALIILILKRLFGMIYIHLKPTLQVPKKGKKINIKQQTELANSPALNPRVYRINKQTKPQQGEPLRHLNLLLQLKLLHPRLSRKTKKPCHTEVIPSNTFWGNLTPMLQLLRFPARFFHAEEIPSFFLLYSVHLQLLHNLCL